MLHAMTPQMLILTLTVLFTLHVQLARSHGNKHLTYIVSKKETACFSRAWTDSEKIFFEYQVIRGAKKDLDVQIISPNGLVLYDKKRSTGDEVTFSPENGEFRFCFNNEFSTLTDKVVTFIIRRAYAHTLSEETGNTEPGVKSSSETSCDNIHEAATATLEFQRKYRIREMIGRHLAERLSSVVAWWSMGQSLIIMLCGVSQVLALKTFFVDRRTSSKPGEGEPAEKMVTQYT